MHRRIILLFLITGSLLFCKSALAATEKFYCDFNNHRVFNCQKSVFTATAQPLNIREKDGSTIYITPQAQLGLDGNQYKILTLRAKAKTNSPRFKINFSDRQIGILSISNFIFRNNNQFIDYYFNLSLSDQWGGTIDRLYLQFVPQDLEIESFVVSPATPILVTKSLWQEFWAQRSEHLAGINGLNSPLLNGIPFIKYFFVVILIAVIVLAAVKYRDRGLAKNWSKVLLIIFLISWLMVAIRTSYGNYSIYFNNYLSRSGQPNGNSEKIIGDLVGSPELAKNLYSFLGNIRNSIPSGTTIFIPPDSGYTYILMVYNLVDRYQIVADINQADYLISFDQLLPASAQDFKLKFSFTPNQLIYQR
jgi:hypothetical protein